MARTMSPRISIFVAAALALTACSPSIQTTSGKAYLKRYSDQASLYQHQTKPAAPAASAATSELKPGTLAPDIYQAAAVEPLLTFPARIGLARIENGHLSAIPPQEGRAWQALAERLGPDWGEFVPLNPLVVGLATQEIDARLRSASRSWYGNSAGLIHDIRIGAARQHTDALLIYETVAESEITSNPLAVTKLLLVGYFLAPSEHVESSATASAVLVDVRNGYTYGTATGVSADTAATLATSVNEDEAEARTRLRATGRAVKALTVEVEEMALKLRTQLAEQRVKQLQAARGNE